jgi:hypothetical protein
MRMLSRFLRPLRRWATSPSRGGSENEVYPLIEIPVQDVSQLLFGQQHLGTQDFFVERCGQYHTLPLSQIPHRQFIRDLAEGKSRPELPYLAYLESSWRFGYGPKESTPDSRAARARRFAEQFQLLSQRQQIEPIRVCQRPDGRLIIVDGNHRASIADQLGLPLRAQLIPLEHHLRNVTTIPDEFYGSKRLDKPYQSIVYRGRELLEGRRKDVSERLQMISPSDLQGKRIIDFGCNLGMSCFLAAELGAPEVLGIEGSPNIASAAVRLNAIFAAPCYFRQHDLGVDLPLEKFDTVFCFSIINHVKDKHAFVRTIDRALGGVMYFEGHAETSQADYSYLLNEQRFSQIELLGYTKDGIHKTSSSRPLWRCVVK